MGPKELVFLKSVLRDGRRGDIQDVRRLSPRQSLRIARAFVGWKGIADEALIGGTEEPALDSGFVLKDPGCNCRKGFVLWRVGPCPGRGRCR